MAQPKSRKLPGPWFWALVSVVAVIVVVMLLPEDLFISSFNWDLPEFASWRSYAADSIRAGHFPLWNAYAYAGEPFLGDYISAELYPPNLLFLILPLARAFNLSLLLHGLLLGWGVRYWAVRRGYHPTAAALAGLAAALSGPVFMRLPAGQVGNLCAMAWAPWMFCALEEAWRGPVLKPVLLAAACVCLQILGGHPQYAFFVAIAAGLHAIVYTVREPALRQRALGVVLGVYVLGALLAAAQILPGIAATAESVRQGKVDYDFARLASFPPENLLTLLAPGFFGQMTPDVYWGRVYLWESCLFVGVSGLVLAFLALVGREGRRWAGLDWTMVVVLFLLALGDHTPLQHILYDYVPGFGQVRCFAKFIFPAILFLSLAIAAGADTLIRHCSFGKWFGPGVVAAGVFAGGLGLSLWQNPAHLNRLLEFVQENLEYRGPAPQLLCPLFNNHAGIQAGQTLATGGLLLVIAGAALVLARFWPRWGWLVLAMLPLELIAFARGNFLTARTGDLSVASLHDYVAVRPGHYRTLNGAWTDGGYLLGCSDLWGDNANVLKRYAEFIAFTQGDDPDHAGQYIRFNDIPGILSLVRFQYAFLPASAVADQYTIITNPGPMPRALLVPGYEVLPGRDAIFNAMAQEDFNASQKVLLESEPTPRPLPGAAPGTVTVTEVNSDLLSIEADTPTPTLLLITDLYSKDWQALALPDSVQQHYEILPADYIVRAIPLSAGHHHLEVAYAPPSFRWGLIISGFTWAGWLGALVWLRRRSSFTASEMI